MSRSLLSLVVFFSSVLAGAVHQLSDSESLDLALVLDFALPLSLVPVVAIYLGARALGFIGGLLLIALVLAELLAPALAAVLALLSIAYGVGWLALPALRERVRAYLERIGLSEPRPPARP